MTESNGAAGHRSRLTIDDVAALARVSIKTVSRVINDEPNVKPATRDRVLEAIRRLDYRPSRVARSLASRQVFVIGLLYDNPSPYYIYNVQSGALKGCEQRGYDLLLHPTTFGNARTPEEIVTLHGQSRFDGVLLTPPLSDMEALTTALREQRVPFVLIAPGVELEADARVCTNDEAVVAEMTRHLVGLGHRRIAFVAGHPDHLAVGKRLSGFLAAMREAGLPVPAEYVAQGYNSFESGEAAARRLLDLPTRPTAIFAANDEMAAGVIKVAHSLGIPLPRELSVAGFDDTPMTTQVWPALSSVRQPIARMAEMAAGMLIEAAASGPVPPTRQLIPSEVVVRESTAPPARSSADH
ncbi:MAG: LacI family DNA-binding transcriptional regulator [Steroidobacteraceae bacterium]